MNHTTLALVAILAAAALVIGAFASPALADSSKTVVKQSNKQKLHQDGITNSADLDSTNIICINTRPCIVE